MFRPFTLSIQGRYLEIKSFVTPAQLTDRALFFRSDDWLGLNNVAWIAWLLAYLNLLVAMNELVWLASVRLGPAAAVNGLA